ncbi:MAG: MmpS family transport accessory protein [Mycobacterium kyogaense]|uniref:MmpS family transport accessory protein n=1 Tax=Mycobacterium kyogaense TaxID=2212479 RepID=UPI002FF58A4E
MKLLARAWVPLVAAVAVIVGGVAVVHLRDAFGSEPVFSASGRSAEPLDPTYVKNITYAVFGPSDSAGSVSYLDVNAQPRQVAFGSLPWSLTVSTTAPAVLASVVAQGDGDSIGCSITVNGDVKDNRSTDGHHAQTSCLVKAA